MTVDHPAVVNDPAQSLRNAFRGLVDEGSLRPEPSQVDWFRGFAHAGDPPADALVEAMAGDDGARVREAVEQSFAGDLQPPSDAPAVVRDFFTRAGRPPYWLDLDEVSRGQQALSRAGVLGLMSLGSLALMGGYLSRRSTKPLVRTGELEAMAPRRLVETATWWLEVTSTGSLAAAGPGVAATLRVRITHAHVRRWMQRRDDWDHEAWDAPVNQIQMAGTHLLFSVACMGGLRRLGVHYDEDERAAIMHLWRYVGWLMGVDPALLPATETDGWRLFWLMAATELDPDDDSRRLADALARGSGLAAARAPEVVVRAGLAFNAGMSRYLLGHEACDALGLGRSLPAAAAVRVLARGVGAAEHGRRLVPGATSLATALGGITRRRFVERAAEQVGADRSYVRDHPDGRGRSGPSPRLRSA